MAWWLESLCNLLDTVLVQNDTTRMGQPKGKAYRHMEAQIEANKF